MRARPVQAGAQVPEQSSALSRRLVFTLAAATGVTVANIYYAQPLLAQIARSFRVAEGQAGVVATLTQVGYAAGLALVVPLGDIVPRHRLVVTVLIGAALALAGAALSPSILLLALMGLIIGLTSVVAQILVPFAADLAPDLERGRVVGTVMSGLLIGILLARTAAGAVAAIWTWRAVFGAAALLMVALAGVLWLTLPRRTPNTPLGYGMLLRSVLTLVRREPVLRRRALYGAFGFGAFSVFWTTAAFLLAGPPYRYGTAAIGAFGLIGAAGAVMASVAGRLADRGLARIATLLFACGVTAAFPLLWLGGSSLAALIAGIVILDVGQQGLHITNQSVIYQIDSAARSRITTAYMTTNFSGGALGSACAVTVYALRGWGAVCALGGVLGAMCIMLWLVRDRESL